MSAPKNAAAVSPIDPFDLLVAALDAAPLDEESFSAEERAEIAARMARAERGESVPRDAAAVLEDVERQLALEK